MTAICVSRRFALASAVLCLPASTLSAQPALAQPESSLSGRWIFTMDGDAQPQRVQITDRGDSVSGRVYGQSFTGTMRRGMVAFQVGAYRWRGRLQGDSLVGWLGVDPDSSRWSAVRETPSRTPRRLTVTPANYARAYAVATPAQRLVSGDTVVTATIDAGGWGPGAFGARANKLAVGGNPLVGPFVVEHALPGDVLEVTLHRVRLNRGWAFSGTQLVDQAIDPAYAASRMADTVRLDNMWMLDTASGVARRATTTGALANYRVPLTPFLGVIATAPSADFAPSSRESGSYGGNMENRWMREGTTVLLPVSQRGAYLYLGDGHAAQGDGELTGDAMETSLDVVFSVAVRRWGFQAQVRAEDATQILSHGVGGSLDEAMRRATTDLARWLEQTWGLTSGEAAIVLGFSVQFDITDVVAPGYGVTARVPKAALPPARR